jgi:hypothetical protein
VILSARAQTAAAAGLYLLFALLLTWPMPLHLGSQVFGSGGDTWADIAAWRELAQGPLIPFLPGTVHDFNAPEGWDYGYAIYVATWPSTLIKWTLSVVLGSVAGWNVYVLAGYVLSGTAMFLLARKVTGSSRAALVAGWAFAFWPWAVENGKGHVEFSHGWVFVVLAWRLLELRDGPTVRNGVLAGAAAILCLSYNPYYLLIGGVMYAVLALAGLLPGLRAGDLLARVRAHAVSAGLVLGALVVYTLVNMTAPASGTRSYGLQELVNYGARPLQYLTPHPDTIVFGERTAGWWATHTQGAALIEKSLYLGVTVLLLAAVAVVAAARRRLPAGGRANAWTFATLGVVAAAFSAPPYFQPWGVTIYMPSYFVFELLPTWRVFSRFGVVVMFAAAMLAAIGLARIMEGRRPREAFAVFAVAAVLVPLDLWAKPETPTIAIPDPPAYSFLEGEPAGNLAEYPVTPNTLPEYTWALNQDIHDRPILNGYAGGSREEARALWLFELGELETARQLRSLGVSHVMLIDRYAPPGVRATQPPGPGFQLVGRAEGRSVWRVIAPPAPGMAWLAQGGSEVVEGGMGNHRMWLVSREGELDVAGGCERCEGILRFSAYSKNRPRRLRLTEPTGRVVLDETVPVDSPREFTLRVAFRRSLRLAITVDPGPEPAGGGDARKISIAIVEPEFEPEP